MSFAALVLSPADRASRGLRTARNAALTLDEQLTLGERVHRFLAEHYPASPPVAGAVGLEAAPLATTDGSQPQARFPYGFWRAFITQELRLAYSNVKILQCSKSHRAFQKSREGDAGTPAAWRGDRRGSSKRNNGGTKNASRSCALSVALFHLLCR